MAARTLRLAHRGDWRAAPGEHARGVRRGARGPGLRRARVRRPRLGRRRPGDLPRRDARADHGRPERVDALTADALEALGVPTLAEVLAAVGRRPVPRRRAQGRSGSAHRRGAGRRPRPGPVECGRLVVRGGALERIAHLAPTWPRWLNMHTLEPGRRGRRGRARLPRRRGRLAGARSSGPWRRAQAAGLEVAAYTVRRRPTFDRLARLGRRRGLRGGHGARRLTGQEAVSSSPFRRSTTTRRRTATPAAPREDARGGHPMAPSRPAWSRGRWRRTGRRPRRGSGSRSHL